MKKQKNRSQIKKSNTAHTSKSKELKIEGYITIFDEYLKTQKGLSVSSRDEYRRVGRLFLHYTFKSRVLHLSTIKNIDITNFINDYAQDK